MIRLIIPGRLPGLNEYIAVERNNRYKAAKLKRDTEQRILLVAKSQLRGVRFSEPVIMRYTWVEPDQRRDKDNIAFAKKFVQDALVRAKVLRDDGWREIKDFTDRFSVDKKDPRVEIEITEAGRSMKKSMTAFDWKPCEHCGIYERHQEYLRAHPEHAMRFCWHCGRPLTEEARTELERRINDGKND